MNITEQMIAEAAAEMNDAMLNSLPNPDDCRHKFSARFERKMRRVIFRVDHPVPFRIVQRVASIVLVLFIGFATILAASPTVRAAVFGWIREQYESFITYYFDDGISVNKSPATFYISGLPEEYVEIAASNMSDIQTYVYADSAGQFLYFSYSTNPDAANYLVKEDGYSVECVSVLNYPADFFFAEDTSQSNCLIWCNEENRVIFYISAFLEKNELIALAESVSPKN